MEPASQRYALCDGLADPSNAFPDDLGDECSSGSNLALCVLPDSTDCSSGLCLWDSADPTGRRAYCSASCDLADPSSCPESFECRVDGCEMLPICVRVAQPQPAPSRAVREEGVVANGFNAVSVAVAASGAYWVKGSGVVLRAPAGGFSTLSQTIPTGQISGIVKGESVYVVVSTGQPTSIVRVSGGDPVELPGSHRGAFKAQDGTLYYLKELGSDVLLTPLSDDLVPDESNRFGDWTLTPFQVAPLRDHGFVGTCDTADGARVLCTSADGRDVRAIDSPNPEATFLPHLTRYNFAPDRLWVIFEMDDGSALLSLYSGGRWHDQDLSARFTPVAVMPLSPTADRAMVFAEDASADGKVEALYLHGDCWQPLHDTGTADLWSDPLRVDASLLQIDDDTVGWLDLQAYVAIELDAFANHR